MANPIARQGEYQATGRLSEETLRAWCWERNQRAAESGWSHWLYVSKDKDTGTLTCKARADADALDVTKVLEGWYPDFMNWSEERLDREFRILRHIVRMGTPQEWFEKRLPMMAKPRLSQPARD